MGAEGYAWTNDAYVTAGYVDENILDKISRIYSNETLADDVRSIRIADIDHALGLKFDETSIYKEADPTNDLMSYTSIGIEYEYEEGDYAPENYLKYRYPERFNGLTNRLVGSKVQGTYYDYLYENSDVVDSSSVIYEILFKDTVGDDVNWYYAGPKAYWLADSGIFTSSWYTANFGPGIVAYGEVENGMFLIGNSGLRGHEYGVKPIVCLKSTVTDEQVKITTGSEPTWTENSGHMTEIWYDEEVFVGDE